MQSISLQIKYFLNKNEDKMYTKAIACLLTCF